MKKTQRRLGLQLVSIRSDHGTKFENSQFMDYCIENIISHNFSTPRTPQQNEVVERKNRTLEDMTRTILISTSLPQRFWAEALSIACYILNRAMLRPKIKKTSYELFRGRKPNISPT